MTVTLLLGRVGAQGLMLLVALPISCFGCKRLVPEPDQMRGVGRLGEHCPRNGTMPVTLNSHMLPIRGTYYNSDRAEQSMAKVVSLCTIMQYTCVLAPSGHLLSLRAQRQWNQPRIQARRVLGANLRTVAQVCRSRDVVLGVRIRCADPADMILVQTPGRNCS